MAASTCTSSSSLARIVVPSGLQATYRPAYLTSSSGGNWERFLRNCCRSMGACPRAIGIIHKTAGSRSGSLQLKKALLDTDNVPELTPAPTAGAHHSQTGRGAG